MKYILFFLMLVSYAAFGQNVSVVSAEKMNVVYRGIYNPIKIAVPGAKSFTATAKDSMLVRVDSIGNYKLYGTGIEMKIDIEAIMQDGSLLHEQKIFRVKGIPAYTGILNDDSRGNCMMTIEELCNSQVNVILEDMLLYEPNVDFGVKGFAIKLTNEKGKSKPTYIVEGNKMSVEIIDEIKKLKPGSMAIISTIKVWNNTPINICRYPSPIVVGIYE